MSLLLVQVLGRDTLLSQTKEGERGSVNEPWIPNAEAQGLFIVCLFYWFDYLFMKMLERLASFLTFTLRLQHQDWLFYFLFT